MKAELLHALVVNYERQNRVKDDYNGIELTFERI